MVSFCSGRMAAASRVPPAAAARAVQRRGQLLQHEGGDQQQVLGLAAVSPALFNLLQFSHHCLLLSQMVSSR
jgi:hypothetical protein